MQQMHIRVDVLSSIAFIGYIPWFIWVIKYIILDREIIKLIWMVTMMVMLVLTKLMF